MDNLSKGTLSSKVHLGSGAALEHSVLFQPYQLGKLRLSNRVVMAPMARERAPGGVMGMENAGYYRRRAEAGVGLLISEGTWIDHPVASDRVAVPRFYGADALAGWRSVLHEVHAAGGRIFPQLHHVGALRRPGQNAWNPEMPPLGPSGLGFPEAGSRRTDQVGPPMTREDIASVVRAFGKAAADAFEIGFDGVEIHGAHGYLIDQFFWDRTNRRTDEYGGGIRERTRLATEVIRECRRCTSPDFPISFRFSQWKQADYEARLANDPFEFETFLLPLVEAGVDIFHCSTRRYWESAFAGSPLTLAGWTRKITDKTTIAVGSVGLDRAHETKGLEAQARYEARPASLERLLEMLDRKEFDLAAVGRAILIDPAWVHKVRVGAFDELRPYSTELRNIMY